MPLDRDIAHPSLEEEKRKHKKKRLVQSPNSYFMDVKCPVMLQDHHSVQPCSDSGSVRWVLNCVVPAYWRKGQAYRRAAHLEESNIECSLCQHDSRYMLLEALSVQKRRLI
ncbi:unnamed protein product [Caretta caretta]